MKSGMATDVTGIGKAVEVAERITQEIRELLSLFLKPAVSETGLWLGDRVHIARERNLQKVLAKAKFELESAGIEIKPVQGRIFIPLADACSLEEDEDMIHRWSNLLIGAVCGNPLLPSYIRLLSELSPEQARLLDSVQTLQTDIGIQKRPEYPVLAVEIEHLRNESKLEADTFERIFTNLLRLNLLRRRHPEETFTGSVYEFSGYDAYFVGTTEFADDFLMTCNRPPTSNRT
jgi:hypothetical protein